MENLFEELGLKSKGIKDYDDLTPVEQETYRKMLEIQQTAAISLDDVKRHIKAMRQSVEYELAKLPGNDARNSLYKARLLNYILMEAIFERPERAKEMLKQYSTRIKL